MPYSKLKHFLLLIFSCSQLVCLHAQTQPRLVLPIGHTGPINSAVFSPDGKLALTASWDHTARVFDVATGKELQVLIGHTGTIKSAVFSPDGKLALTASYDHTARVFDLFTGKELQILSGHTRVLETAVFSPDGKLALTASSDNTARVFDLATGKELQVLTGHTNDVESALFSPNGKLALTASEDLTARLFDIATGKELQVFSGHTKKIHSAVFSPDGKLALTASWDSTARVFDISTGKVLQVLRGHTSRVESAVFSPDGKLALISGDDQTARVFDLATGKELQVFNSHKGLISSAVFSPDGKLALTASWDQTARVFDVATGKELKVFNSHTGWISSAVFSPDGKLVLTASYDQTARVFDLASGRELQVLTGHTLYANSAVFSPDGKLAITAIIDQTARVFDIDTGKELQVLTGHTESVKSSVFSHDGKLELTAGYDTTARVFDLATGKELQVLSGHTSEVNSAVYSPNGKLAITASDDQTARVFDIATGKELHVLRGHTNGVNSAVFSSDGKLVLTASSDLTARVFDIATSKEMQVLTGHRSAISSAIFSPDGKLALTASWDYTARVYEIATGKELLLLSGHTDWIKSAVFSPNGKMVLTASADHTARVFDSATGKELLVLIGHASELNSAIFSPDGKLILTTARDHKTTLWDVATGKPLYTRLQLAGDDWLIYDEHYRFDGTAGAIEKLYFVSGLEVIELGQMKDALYVPGLASKILNGEDVNYKKLSDLDICGALPIIEKTNESPDGWDFSIEQRRWPIIRLEVKVDGKNVKTIPAAKLKFTNGKVLLKLTLAEMQAHLKSGQENKVSVVAVTEENGVEYISRSVVIELEAEGEKTAPSLYMLMIGVNDYKDDALDLRFPVKDAQAFSAALESSAQKLLGADKVFVYNVQSKIDTSQVYTTPERAGVMKALQEIGSKAKTNDVLFIFFAGHGVMQGADNTFTFLTADASKINPVGISTTDLKSWLSPEGPFHMMPNKTVLVYDACNSGQAAKEMMADLALARDDDATERQRQIEDLGDKQGVFILSASAPNQSAYELPHLGQGMLTYSLLSTLKNNPAVLDEDQNGKGFLNLQKWFLETEREQSRLMQSLGLKQDAQPYGTANIRIGLVDDEVRNGISLMAEKPLVYCSNARNDSDEDPLNLKEAVNSYLETAMTRGTTSKLGYIKAETSQANILKLVYNTSGDKIQCRILVFKNKVKVNELSISTSASKAAVDIVNAVEGIIK